VREQASWRRRRLVAKGDQEETAVLAALHQEIAALPEGAVFFTGSRSDRQAHRRSPAYSFPVSLGPAGSRAATPTRRCRPATIAMNTYLRLMLIKQRMGWDYES